MRQRIVARALAVAVAVALTLTLPSAPMAAAPGCAPPRHPGGDWPVQGQGPLNTRMQPSETTLGPDHARALAPAWEVNSAAVEAAGAFTATPVVAKGCMYIGSTAGWVLALNADTGDLVWKTKLPQAVNNSVTVDGDDVFAVTGLRVAALDRRTGKVRWESKFIDVQDGSDTYGSPVVFTYRGRRPAPARRVLFTGVSGGTAETGDDERRAKFRGRLIFLDADSGRILKRTWVIPNKAWKKGYAGGGVWATAALDPKSGYGYVGTGNPFQPQVQHPRTNAIIKFDMNPARRSFGRIVRHYSGTLDEYVEDSSDMPCLLDVPGNPPPWYPQGLGACADQDLDFGASPNLFRDGKGRLLVGEGQKSGEYHVLNAKTMKPRYVSLVGPPTLVGGIVGTTAVDDGHVYGPVTTGGYLWSVARRGGALRWVSPVGDGVHFGHAVSIANGVVYTIDLAGLLRAYDAESGRLLMVAPQSTRAPVGVNLGGGVSIARNTVYAVNGGAVIAHRPPAESLSQP